MYKMVKLIKYGKFSGKKHEEILQNTFFVYLIILYNKSRKEK